MALYQLVDGEWTLCQRPYVKYGGVLTAAKNAYVKVNGTWQMAYAYDTTPPDPPAMDLILHEDRNNDGSLKERWIRVGVRMSDANHDPTVAAIRVNTTYNDTYSTSPFAPTINTTPDSSYPGEPWCDWRYGPGNPHQDTSKYVYKQWPINAAAGTQLRGDRTYYFSAWAVDYYDNWSRALNAKLTIPKGGVDEPTTHLREAFFTANHTGSWKNTSWWDDGYGRLHQQKTGKSAGLWFYGTQIKDALGPNSVIKSAQIYVPRANDSGKASANITAFWHGYGNPGNLPAAGTPIVKNQPQPLGTLAKNQGAWFSVPNQFRDDMKAGNVRGIGLDWKQKDATDATDKDYSICYGIAEVAASGQIHVVWEDPA